MSTAEINGKLWGARARDWAEYGESTAAELFDAVLKKIRNGKSTTLLDVGCGAGGFCQMASGAGINVTGFDASENLIAIARERLPEAEFKTGDMAELPYPSETFDVVTGLNSFQFADDIPGALKEAGRVTKKGGKVVMAIWGKPDDCDASVMFAALAQFMPPPPHAKDSGKKPLFTPGVLEDIAASAGLMPESAEEVKCTWNFKNKETALRAMMSAGLIEIAIRNAGIEKITEAISGAIEQFRRPDGSYRLINTFRCLVAAN